jgi:hypothetical protein
LRLKTNLVSILVDDVCALDNNRRNERAGNSNSEEREHSNHDVDTRCHPSSGENGRHRGDQTDEDEPDSNAVQHKHRLLQDSQRIDPLLDVGRPVEVRQRNIDAALVERALQNLGGVERVHGRHVRAPGYILADVGGRDSGVGQVGRRVVAVAVVEDVGGVEVVDSKGLRNVAGELVEFLLDAVGDVVEERTERVGMVAGIGRVEEVGPDT